MADWRSYFSWSVRTISSCTSITLPLGWLRVKSPFFYEVNTVLEKLNLQKIVANFTGWAGRFGSDKKVSLASAPGSPGLSFSHSPGILLCEYFYASRLPFGVRTEHNCDHSQGDCQQRQCRVNVKAFRKLGHFIFVRLAIKCSSLYPMFKYNSNAQYCYLCSNICSMMIYWWYVLRRPQFFKCTVMGRHLH